MDSIYQITLRVNKFENTRLCKRPSHKPFIIPNISNLATYAPVYANTYDALGRLATKTTGGLETTAYSYNVRSWPTKIQGPKFTELLAYNEAANGLTPSTPQFSGKVAAQRWYHGSTTLVKPLYLFTYDGAADTQPTYSGAQHFADLADETAEYKYNENGNMTKDLKIPIEREQSELVCYAEHTMPGMRNLE